MLYRDQNEFVDNIKTLDEAKELIQYLLRSQQAINTVLTYELRTPLVKYPIYIPMRSRLTQAF